MIHLRRRAVIGLVLGSLALPGCRHVSEAPDAGARSWDAATDEDATALNHSIGPGEAEAITVLQEAQPRWPAGTVLVIRTATIRPYIYLGVPSSMVTTAQASPFPNGAAPSHLPDSRTLPKVWLKALADGSDAGQSILPVRIENFAVTDLRLGAVEQSLSRGGAWTKQLGLGVPPQTLYLVRGYITGRLMADTSRSLTPELFTALTKAPGLAVAPNPQGGFSMSDPRPRPLFQIISTIVRRPATASYALAKPTQLELWNLLNAFDVSPAGRAGAPPATQK